MRARLKPKLIQASMAKNRNKRHQPKNTVKLIGRSHPICGDSELKNRTDHHIFLINKQQNIYMCRLPTKYKGLISRLPAAKPTATYRDGKKKLNLQVNTLVPVIRTKRTRALAVNHPRVFHQVVLKLSCCLSVLNDVLSINKFLNSRDLSILINWWVSHSRPF